MLRGLRNVADCEMEFGEGAMVGAVGAENWQKTETNHKG